MTLIDRIRADRRAFITGSAAWAAGGLLASGGLQAQQLRAGSFAAGDYKPRRGQSGKDVIWIPTPDLFVTRMLRLAQVTPQDFVIDLGSGDGKIVIVAAREGALGMEELAQFLTQLKRGGAPFITPNTKEDTDYVHEDE